MAAEGLLTLYDTQVGEVGDEENEVLEALRTKEHVSGEKALV